MLLAISGQSLGADRSLGEILSVLNDLDVRWIDLWPENVEGGDFSLAGSTHRYEGREIDKVETELNAHGIGVSCVSMPGAFSTALAADPEDYLSALKKAIDVADFLRAKLVNSYVYNFAREPGAPIDTIASILRTAVDHAAVRDITLVLENEAHDTTATVTGMRRIIDEVSSPWLKTTLDAANYYQAGEEPFPLAYKELKDVIGYLHLKGGCSYVPEWHPEWGRGGEMTGSRSGGHIFYPPLNKAAYNVEQLLTFALGDHVSEFCMIEPHVPASRVEDYYRVEVPYLRRHGVH